MNDYCVCYDLLLQQVTILFFGNNLLNEILIHHNLFITPLQGSEAKYVLAKQTCCIQTKIYRSYRKMTINGLYFYLGTILLGTNFKSSYIRNCLIKRFQCMTAFTVNVLKFQTLYSISFWPKVCFLCTCFLQFLVEWQTV